MPLPATCLPDLPELLCFAVYSTAHAFNRVYKPLLDRLGLTYPQYLVMVRLWTQDDQTVGALCGALHLESSTLTPLLKRVEALGLVSRRRDPADERQVRVSLTPAGQALHAQAQDVPACILAATGLTPEALQRLTTTLNTLRDTLTEAGGDAP